LASTGERDLFLSDHGAALVDQVPDHGDRRDLALEPALRLGRSGPSLAFHRIGVLHLAAHAIAARHVLRRVDHRHVDVRPVLGEPLVLSAKGVAVRVDQGNRLDAPRHLHIAFAAPYPLGGEGDGLQAGRAFAVQRHAGHANRQAGAQSRLPGDVRAHRALAAGRAQQHVLHLGRIEPRPLQGGADHVGGHAGAVDVVQRAPVRLADRRAGGGDDGGVFHFRAALCVVPSRLGAPPNPSQFSVKSIVLLMTSRPL
jgi:hypothetical protein